MSSAAPPAAAAAAAAPVSTPVVWSQGAFANGTGPGTLPVLDPSTLAAATPFPALTNDLILRTARHEKTERTPVWCHRQAGRSVSQADENSSGGGGSLNSAAQCPSTHPPRLCPFARAAICPSSVRRASLVISSPCVARPRSQSNSRCSPSESEQTHNRRLQLRPSSRASFGPVTDGRVTSDG